MRPHTEYLDSSLIGDAVNKDRICYYQKCRKAPCFSYGECQREYENLIENLQIQTNEYLVNKLKKGMSEIEKGNVLAHPLIEE